jgi:hypothetical protein
MKAIGIWMDGQEAYVVRLMGEQIQTEQIKADVDYHLRKRGEGKQYTRMGSSFFGDEQKKEIKLKNQKIDYFDAVIGLLDPDFELLVIGPGEVKKEFVKHLNELSAYKHCEVSVETTDKLTHNQIVAWVKNYFALNSVRTTKVG